MVLAGALDACTVGSGDFAVLPPERRVVFGDEVVTGAVFFAGWLAFFCGPFFAGNK
jgi:hypothetical protein